MQWEACLLQIVSMKSMRIGVEIIEKVDMTIIHVMLIAVQVVVFSE